MIKEGIIIVGNKPADAYVTTALKCFGNRNKVVFAFMEEKRKKSKEILKMLDKGGYVIGMEVEEKEKYEKQELMLTPEQTEDGKGGVVEYYPENDNCVIKCGRLKEEVKNSLGEIISRDGKKSLRERTVYYVEVHKK